MTRTARGVEGPLLTHRRLGVRRMYPEAILDVDSIKPFLADSQIATEQSRHIAKNLITLPTHQSIHNKLAEKIAHKTKHLLATHETIKLNT